MTPGPGGEELGGEELSTVELSTVEIGADEARAAILRAQGLTASGRDERARRRSLGPRSAAVESVLHRLGAVQLDTISVLARSHELVPYARLGAVGRDAVEHAYWHHEPGDARVFEYWSHAACLLPVDAWPLFAFRRRSMRANGRRWHDVDEAAVAAVLARLRDEGPLTSADLGGARARRPDGTGGEWWDWSGAKVAVEWLLDVGEVVVTERRGWRRVYDLPERALPATVLGTEPDDETCIGLLVARAARQLGVATVADLADQHRLTRAQTAGALPRLVADGAVVPVTVPGWSEPAFADPAALSSLTAAHGGARERSRTTLLSPFDSLVWDRRRTARVFGVEHRLEAYTPASDRVHGYFAMPVLAGGRIVARVDPGREGRVLVAKRVTFESTSERAVTGTARALREAATWVGCDDVRVDVVDATLRPRLDAALRAAAAPRARP